MRYPHDEMLAVIAAAAAAADVTIVGENLGTVPDRGRRRARRMGCSRHVRGTVPSSTTTPCRTSRRDRSPASAPTTWRRSPNSWPPRDTADYRRRLGDAHGCEIDDRWDAVVEQMLVRLACERCVPGDRRSRRPARRDATAQPARSGRRRSSGRDASTFPPPRHSVEPRCSNCSPSWRSDRTTTPDMTRSDT